MKLPNFDFKSIVKAWLIKMILPAVTDLTKHLSREAIEALESVIEELRSDDGITRDEAYEILRKALVDLQAAEIGGPWSDRTFDALFGWAILRLATARG